jgi:hypothetical protein
MDRKEYDMTASQAQPTETMPRTPSAFEATQYEQAFETYKSSLAWYVQLTVALVAANATLLVYAIRMEIAGVMLVGPVFPGVIAYMYGKFRRLALPALYTAVSIERRAGPAGSDWLASTLVSQQMSRAYVQELQDIAALDDPEERMARLRRVPPPILAPGEELGIVFLVGLALLQVALAVLLPRLFGWRFM